MEHNGVLNLAVGMSARSKVWKNKNLNWSDIVERLLEENKTNETYKEYISASKQEQSKIKDVGGYVGGYLRNGRRKPENVLHRQLMTLDIDFAHVNFWDDFTLQFENSAVLHATHTHSEKNPRYRLIMPLSREVTADEYVAISRKIAGILGIDLFDNTTFETNRLMFWPSNPKDIDYYAEFQDGPWVDADEILSTYTDWTDSSSWPTAEKQFQTIKTNAQKQQDPEAKRGVVGSFCRAYPISEAIDTFLADEYEKATDDRYTYKKGTTAAGLMVYDDKFAFSHHGTDPSSGKLCNSFDLVRIHKFGHLDGDSTISGAKAKSFKGMEELARKDEAVKQSIASDKLAESKYDFAEDFKEEAPEIDIDWMKELEIDGRGTYLSTAVNLNLIFSNDERLKKVFRHNSFDNKRYIFESVPWRKVKEAEPMKNVDYSGVRNYIESIYGITGNLKIDDSLALEIEKNSFHPVRDYLKALEWDGVERVDNVLIEYFGAENNIYSKEAIRKTMVGAVGRIFVPGIKFDLVLTLVGKEGTGKSHFVKKIGVNWSSDTFMTVHGKEALEQIQGAWLIEMAELAGIKKADVEPVKHFITKQEDTFRHAYARTSETYKRQCVFIGTTNSSNFLTDPSGNRRFVPIDINMEVATKSVFNDLDRETVDQLWAEAVQLFEAKEKLYMSKEAEEIARIERKIHSEIDERSGVVEKYLNTKLTEDWKLKEIYDRVAYFEDPLSAKGDVERDFVCVAEIWCECLGNKKEDMDRYKTRAINEIMKGLEDWEQLKSTKLFPIYGRQRYYSRKLD